MPAREIGASHLGIADRSPHLLVSAGVHGDEIETIDAVVRLRAQLESLDVAGCVTLVPIVNERAFRARARVAEDGLDLARVCPGRSDGSPTERAASELSRLIRAADHYVDLHTGGSTFAILPFAGYMCHPDQRVLERQRLMARAFNLQVVWGTDHRLEGRSLSVARDAGVPAIYVEYGGGGSYDANAVEGCVVGCLNVMAALGMVDRPVPASAVRHEVEDRRPGSGHLQQCHRSPADGLFEARVALGQVVRRGAKLGVVRDSRRRAALVRSAGTGLVLALRSCRRVSAGDALAVVLELETDTGGGNG